MDPFEIDSTSVLTFTEETEEKLTLELTRIDLPNASSISLNQSVTASNSVESEIHSAWNEEIIRWINDQPLKTTFDAFPYYLSTRTRDILLTSASVHLNHIEFRRSAKLNPGIVLLGQSETETYRQELAASLANQFKSKLVSVDSSKICSLLAIEAQKESSFLENSCDEIQENKVTNSSLSKNSNKDKECFQNLSDISGLFWKKSMLKIFLGVIENVAKNEPLIVFLENPIQSIIHYKDVFVTLKNYIKNSSRVFFIFSQSNMNSSEVNNDELFQLSSSRLTIVPPKKKEQLCEWNNQMERDAKGMQTKRILAMLKSVFMSCNIVCKDLDEINKVSTLISISEAKEIVGWSLGHYLLKYPSLTNSPKNECIKISKDSVEYALKLWDGDCLDLDEAFSASSISESKTKESNESNESNESSESKESKALNESKMSIELNSSKENESVKNETTKCGLSNTVETIASPEEKSKTKAIPTPEASEVVKTKPAEEEKSSPPNPTAKPTPPPPKKEAEVAPDNEFEKRIRPEVIEAGSIQVSFDSIGALDEVKILLKELVMLPLQRPDLFVEGGLIQPCKGILLFGPPGTGKTMLAKAIASEAGANFFNISMSAITSKWFGEDEKNVRALFTLAAKMAPAVIFIDEVDSMLGRRSRAGEHEAMRKIKNEFMAHWDGLMSSHSNSNNILVLAATNRPFDLDDAIIRRFQRRIMVSLPDENQRVKILESILHKQPIDSDFDLVEIAKMTEGFSGSDLKNLCVTAAYFPIRELLAKEKEKSDNTLNENEVKNDEVKQDEVKKDEVKKDEVKNDEVKKDEIIIDEVKNGENNSKENRIGQKSKLTRLRPLSIEDIKLAKLQISASTSSEATNMQELKEWNELYGEGGTRKKAALSYFL